MMLVIISASTLPQPALGLGNICAYYVYMYICMYTYRYIGLCIRVYSGIFGYIRVSGLVNSVLV